MSAPAIAGAGGCVTPPCPTRWIATWRVRSKRMHAITPRGIKGKRHRAAKDTWDVGRVVAARNASPAGAITIKIGRR